MSKALLIGAVRQAAPDIRSDIAAAIVEAVLEFVSSEVAKQRVSLTGAVQRAVPKMSEKTAGNVTDEVLQTLNLELANQKSRLTAVVLRSVPGAHADLANEIVQSFLDVIGNELVNQGSFTLQKIGSLTLRQKTNATGEDAAFSDSNEVAGGKRLPGVAARYQVSRFLADRVRSAAAEHAAVQAESKRSAQPPQ